MSLRGAGRPGVVSVKESSRVPSWLRPPPRAPAARSELRTARGPGSGSRSARPPRRRGRRRRCASPGGRAADRRPPARDRAPRDRHRGKPGTPCSLLPRVPSPPAGPGRDAGPALPGRWLGPGRTFRSPGRPAPAVSVGAGCGPRSAPTRAGGADRTRRSPSFLSVAGASEPAGRRAGRGAESSAHCAPRASVWPPRTDVDPPAPDLSRPRSLDCPPPRERPLPLGMERDAPPRRRPPPSLRAVELPASAGPSGPRSPPRAPGLPRERDAAAPRVRELVAVAGGGTGVNAERCSHRTKRSRRRDWESGRAVGLGTRPRTEAQDRGGL